MIRVMLLLEAYLLGIVSPLKSHLTKVASQFGARPSEASFIASCLAIRDRIDVAVPPN
jgi:hypothetical protein